MGKDGVPHGVKGSCFIQNGLGGLSEEVIFVQKLGQREGGSQVSV